MKPLLSVVVPVFNVEQYIDRCILSILNQSYKNIQIILVDDGSEDCSGAICDNYSLMYSSIKVVHQSNRGSAAARCVGIEMAEGEYVIWVDSDDWIEPDYLEKMMEQMLRNDVDLVAADLFADIGSDSAVVTNGIANGIYHSQMILNRMLYTGSFFEYGIQPHGVTKLFKTCLLKDVQRSLDVRITIGDDAAVVYPYLARCNYISVTDICGYHYVQRTGSLTKKKDKRCDYIDILIDYLKNIFADNTVLLQQLNIYRNYLLALRNLSFWDERGVLYPYGGCDRADKIVIYGAGGMGQSLYSYCKEHGIAISAWIDKNYEYYMSINFPVISFDNFINNVNAWDYILIANTSESVTRNIKDYLIGKGIGEEKIKWFSECFLKGEG